jgi:16S rRNA (uracil1498-N3)-methyltransferase
MRMPAGRFIVTSEVLTEGTEIVLPAAVAHQARDVLRLGPGDALTLLDGAGGEWAASLTEVGRAGVRARVHARRASTAEPRTRIVLCPGLLKAAKFEWVLQKGTELGVAAFVPVLSARAVAGVAETGGAKRARWQRILAEASEQCGRVRVPELAEPRPLPQALQAVPSGAIPLILWEGERATPLRAALVSALEQRRTASGLREPGAAPEIHLFVGPEGGFSADEIGAARTHGAAPVTLGPRILRAETAAIVAAALAMEACGELG